MTQDNKNEPVSVEGASAVEAEATAAATTETSGEDRIAALEDQAIKLKNEVLYARAETENVRRRLEQQAEDRGRYAVSQFAKDMLTVADNLRRALDSIPEAARTENETASNLVVGVELTERELLGTLERYGIRPVEALHQRFDPNFHQAMMEVEDPSQPEGTVVMVMQHGYTIADRLLRPALVGVSKGGPKAPPGEQVDTTA